MIVPTTARPQLGLTECPRHSVHPELVEGLCFLSTDEKGQGFDKLSLNGF